VIVRFAEGIIDTAVIAIRSLNNTTISVIRVVLRFTVKHPIERRGSGRKGC
jgi:hypothetical protein